MYIFFAAFWVVLIAGMYKEDITPTEGSILGGLWIAFLLGIFFLEAFAGWFYFALIIMTFGLVLKVVGGATMR